VELLLLVLDIFDGLKTKCSMNVRVCNMKLLTWETGITCAHAICRNHGMEHFKIGFFNLVMQGVFCSHLSLCISYIVLVTNVILETRTMASSLIEI
jgi:hypothetical protein